jgi:predicted PurR-regulated permease PerM
MSLPNRISFGFLLVVLILAGWLKMGTLLLSVLFSYFILTKLNFTKSKMKWIPVALFLTVLAVLAYALTYFIHATVKALPHIAEHAVPAVIEWARVHQIQLPFTDLESLKDQAFEFARSRASELGAFADFARGATTEFIYLAIGCVVAVGLFFDPRLDAAPHGRGDGVSLYSLCCEEITERFVNFYTSFDMVMNAQITISAINTVLTGAFVAIMGLPHLVVAIGVTFLSGFLPVVGNLVSSALVVALGFTVSSTKGLWALLFLVVVHKLEYFLNSKIIGAKIHTSIWLTLLALLLGERLMGVTGMVLAPVLLHYIRVETSNIRVESTGASHEKRGKLKE